MQLTNKQIAQSLHSMMDGFKKAIGETPYMPWDKLPQSTVDMYMGAVLLIQNTPHIQPDAIHQYWAEWALRNRPDHPSIIPYEELIHTEKLKDMLVISLVKTLSTAT